MGALETRSGVRGNKYRLIFFLHGKRYAETLAVETEDDAQTVKRNAERTLALIAEGHKDVPVGADIGGSPPFFQESFPSGVVVKEWTTTLFMPSNERQRILHRESTAQGFYASLRVRPRKRR